MAYTAPTTRATNDLITATIWNTDMVDNIIYLKSSINAEIQISAGALIPNTTQGAARGEYETANYQMYNVMDYADTAGEVRACVGFVMPSDYNGGTISAKFIWTANSTSTNSVVWGIKGMSYADDEAINASWGSAGTVTDANKSSAYDLNVTASTAAITIGGTSSAGEYVMFMIYRDGTSGSDNLAATARLLSTVLTYTRT